MIDLRGLARIRMFGIAWNHECPLSKGATASLSGASGLRIFQEVASSPSAGAESSSALFGYRDAIGTGGGLAQPSSHSRRGDLLSRSLRRCNMMPSAA
jgi:hypothetical protein